MKSSTIWTETKTWNWNHGSDTEGWPVSQILILLTLSATFHPVDHKRQLHDFSRVHALFVEGNTHWIMMSDKKWHLPHQTYGITQVSILSAPFQHLYPAMRWNGQMICPQVLAKQHITHILTLPFLKHHQKTQSKKKKPQQPYQNKMFHELLPLGKTCKNNLCTRSESVLFSKLMEGI